MKQYIAFICREYESNGGWNDFYTYSDDLEYLKNALTEKIKNESQYTGEYWFHIADMETGQIVFTNKDIPYPFKGKYNDSTS